MRLRRWLSDAGVPLSVAEENGRYHLRAEEPLALRIPGPRTLSGTEPPRLTRLDDLAARVRGRHGAGPVRASDVEALMGCGRSTAVALLREACGAGIMLREGAGPASRYRLKA